MNIPVAIISAGIGAALFAAMNAFQYRPSLITPDYSLGMIFATKHSKARTAVTRLLIDPASADFSALRSVEENAAEYVCGTVRAKDKSGHYVEYRAFVYTVTTDFARIDDDGRIAHRHGAYSRCPISEEEVVALRKIPIAPVWRGEQPPAAWPTFPLDHPLARPVQKRTTAQAMALAKDVEDRWKQSNSGASNSRPSSDDVKEACRALLAINPNDEAFPGAWAAFVRLRKIDRDTAS
jgi:hypothetical protein